MSETIRRFAGNTYPVRVYLQHRGEPLPIDGAGFVLYVGPKADDSVDFSSVGAIVDVASAAIEFPLTAQDAAQAKGEYGYELVMTTAGGKTLTVGAGAWVVDESRGD